MLVKYAIISDIHEDIKSLKRVINQIEKSGAHKLVCLGDITGFSTYHNTHKNSKDANACISLIKSNCDIIVSGNHDFNMVDKLPSYLKRHLDANSHSPKETWSYKDETDAMLSPVNIDFLKQLPEYSIEQTDNFQILFSHFLFPDITGSTIVIPKKKRAIKPHFNFMKIKNCLLSFVGHSHINGFALYRGRHISFRDFGNKRLSKRQQIIFGPAVARTDDGCAYMIFDTANLRLSVIKHIN